MADDSDDTRQTENIAVSARRGIPLWQEDAEAVEAKAAVKAAESNSRSARPMNGGYSSGRSSGS